MICGGAASGAVVDLPVGIALELAGTGGSGLAALLTLLAVSGAAVAGWLRMLLMCPVLSVGFAVALLFGSGDPEI